MDIFSFKDVSKEFYYYAFFIIISIGSLIFLVYRLLNKKYEFNSKSVFKIERKKEDIIGEIIEKLNKIKTVTIFNENEKIIEINRKTKILKPKFESFELTLDGLVNIWILSTIFFSIVIYFWVGWNLIVLILLGVPSSVAGVIFWIEDEYMKKQKKFERKISEIGLIIKQLVALNKGISVILRNLSETKDKIISEEFTEIYNEYNNTNSVKRGLDKISERYPNSLYLKTIRELLMIYVDHQRNIMNEIDTLIKEIESFERIKKKIEVEFAKQDKTILFLIIFSILAIMFFVGTNDMFKVFYISKTGISIALGVFIYIGIGLFAIQVFKMEIIKERKAKKRE